MERKGVDYKEGLSNEDILTAKRNNAFRMILVENNGIYSEIKEYKIKNERD